MQSMKLKAAEKKEMTAPSAPEAPEYPYGLTIDLNKDMLEKLGFKKAPAVGKEFMVQAIAHVRSMSKSEHEEGEGHESCCLQITHLELKRAPAKDEKAERMYGEKG